MLLRMISYKKIIILVKPYGVCSLSYSLTFNVSSKNHLVQHKKHYHRKVLLSSFHLYGHTMEFHPQTQKLEPPCTT